MSAIRQALAKLDGAVGKLEGSMGGLEQALAGQQRDMFGNTSNENAPIDAAVVAQRLDTAIEKVEGLLKTAAQ